ncbi:TetR-like C-terminal domain-containing protein [Streptomyces sp. FH025]|uniref:TetR-like C-terminal domain-containing protein n=1 Tax=Streptomyces sp. FH025 TaxID=2815937 RepID=UPI001A9CE086|nr:TetR-like C-terminal domain-containing protein [Streptomyces sp. FH025]MBO1414343.1 TetR/AcrR family transcriptional regulator C-terminal ligand-binding domain-containing protein [Streptomyces sp. FH025]
MSAETETVRAAAAAAPLRRRGEALENAIYEAVLHQLTGDGYARLTMEGVAAAAQTGKAALYRRWSSKEELVMDALRASLPPAGPAPDTGSLREDLLEVVARLRAAMVSELGAAVRAIMSELDHQRAHAFLELVLERVVEPTTRLIAEALDRGAARGEVRPGAVSPLVTDVVPALMLYRIKMCGGGPVELDPAAIVDEVLLPIVRP